MKKIINIAIILLLFTSCKKEHACYCDGWYETSFKTIKKSEAESKCANVSSTKSCTLDGSKLPSSYTNNSTGCTAVQCIAYTQSNVQCTRQTTNCNGRCWQHQ